MTIYISCRRAGRTTEQIKTAPPGAVFVWANDQLSYPKELARALGRGDLRIVPPSWLDDRSHGCRNPVRLDHAFRHVESRTQQRRDVLCLLDSRGLLA